MVLRNGVNSIIVFSGGGYGLRCTKVWVGDCYLFDDLSQCELLIFCMYLGGTIHSSYQKHSSIFS